MLKIKGMHARVAINGICAVKGKRGGERFFFLKMIVALKKVVFLQPKSQDSTRSDDRVN